MSINKYVGHRVTIIYLDGQQKFSQRLIRIRELKNGIILAFDESREGPRSFKVDRVLAIQPVIRDAS